MRRRRVKYLRVEDPEPLAVARLKSTMLDVDDATWFQHHGTAEADAFNTVSGTGFGEDLAARIVLKDSEGAAVDTVEVSDLTRVSDGEFTFKLLFVSHKRRKIWYNTCLLCRGGTVVDYA